MTCDVKVLARSRNPGGTILTSVQLTYWRAIHAELMTHRVFSRNASSSRAVPVKTMLKQVWSNPAGPIHWGQNQSGMQARNQLHGWRRRAAQLLWLWAGRTMCVFAWLMMQLGLHKQVANRLLEPWQYIHVVVSATEWSNFYALRCHPDAQPEIQELADTIFEVMRSHKPRDLKAGEWHLPYVDFSVDHWLEGVLDAHDVWPDPDREKPRNLLEAIKASVARCARTSYITHGDKQPNLHKDFQLHDRLVLAVPMHASPTEHQAQALADNTRIKNFVGWRQYRDFLDSGELITGHTNSLEEEQPA